MHEGELLFSLVFFFVVFILLILDLGVFTRTDHEITTREAAIWTFTWVMLAFGWLEFLVWFGDRLHSITSMEKLIEVTTLYGQHIKIIPGDLAGSLVHYRNLISLEFLSGYLVEYSLSIDNIFVMILIFSAFGVKKNLFHRVLFWGILGAVVFRFIFIFAGAYMVSRFSWILYIFAAFLVYTGIDLFLKRNKKEAVDKEHHPVVRFASKVFPVHKKFEGNKFFISIDGKKYITPLFLVLLVIEFSDIIFAVDSIPAIFAVTRDPYIVFFSNIFAILGLRSMFFLLMNVVDKLRFFKHGLSLLLIFIGLKMIFDEPLKHIGFTIVHSLLVITLILAASISLSLLFPKKPDDEKST